MRFDVGESESEEVDVERGFDGGGEKIQRHRPEARGAGADEEKRDERRRRERNRKRKEEGLPAAWKVDVNIELSVGVLLNQLAACFREQHTIRAQPAYRSEHALLHDVP